MPEGGIEPPRGCPPGILSPVRLPIPPPRPVINLTTIDLGYQYIVLTKIQKEEGRGVI